MVVTEFITLGGELGLGTGAPTTWAYGPTRYKANLAQIGDRAHCRGHTKLFTMFLELGPEPK